MKSAIARVGALHRWSLSEATASVVIDGESNRSFRAIEQNDLAGLEGPGGAVHSDHRRYTILPRDDGTCSATNTQGEVRPKHTAVSIIFSG